MINATIEEELIEEAKLGLLTVNLKIGKIKAQKLQENGCEVTDSKEYNYFPRFHRISWKNAIVKCKEDVSTLNEDDPSYSLAEKLWIIAMKSRKI